MFILLAIGCVAEKVDDSGEAVAEPPIDVSADIQGLSVGEMHGGFGYVESGLGFAHLTVVLTTYPDACDAWSGFYRALAERLEADPDVYGTAGWSDVLDDAGAEFPSEPYDTITFVYKRESPDTADLLADDYRMLAGHGNDLEGTVRLEAGRTGYHSDYDVLEEAGGQSSVTALDPATADGEVTLEGSVAGVGQATGTLTFAFEVPSCPSFLVAEERYRAAIPEEDGC